MRRIQPELTEELLQHFEDPKRVGQSDPFPVSTFRELVEHTAKLAFKNKDHLIFYRGQAIDFKNKGGSSSFYPNIYRGEHLSIRELENRFAILKGASEELVELFQSENIEGYRELKRRKAVQWSVLQHYEVCHTPYLDFTHSLRVACSFATLDNKEEYAYIFVFGFPYLTNRISINSEHDLINIRLLSICPPTALRPYFQEGYLAGTDDITTIYESKAELDFNNRLIAKFRIPNNDDFWGKGFDKIPKKSLYPSNDPIFKLCDQIKENSIKQRRIGGHGEFLKLWSILEEKLFILAHRETEKLISLKEATRIVNQKGYLSNEQSNQIVKLKSLRNSIVHFPSDVNDEQVHSYLSLLKTIIQLLLI